MMPTSRLPLLILAAVFFNCQGCEKEPARQSTSSPPADTSPTWESLDTRYPLPLETRQILETLPAPVAAHLFYSDGCRIVDYELQEQSKALHLFLHQLASASGGKLTLHVHDTLSEPEACRIAEEAGLLGLFQEKPLLCEQVYYGLSLSSEGRITTIPIVSNPDVSKLEFNVLRGLLQISRDNPFSFVVLTTPSVQLGPQSSEKGPVTYALTNALPQNASVKYLSALNPGDLDKVDCLILFLSKSLETVTVSEIDEYVLNGGKVIVLADPFAATQAAVTPGGANQSYIPSETLRSWGVQIPADTYTMDPAAATDIGFGTSGSSSLVLTLLDQRAEKWPYAHSAPLVLPYAGTIDIAEDQSVSVERLLRASEQASTAHCFEGIYPTILESASELPGPKKPLSCLAAVMRGQLPSLRDSGKRGDKAATVVLVADTDFLTKEVALSTSRVGDVEFESFRNDNIMFMRHLVSMCTIDQPILAHTPSSVYEDLRRYRMEKLKVSAEFDLKLEELRAELAAHTRATQEAVTTSKQDGDKERSGQILSNEQLKAIDDYRREAQSIGDEMRRLEAEQRHALSLIERPRLLLPDHVHGRSGLPTNLGK